MRYWILKLNKNLYLTENFGTSEFVEKAKVFHHFTQVQTFHEKYGGHIIECTVEFKVLEWST